MSDHERYGLPSPYIYLLLLFIFAIIVPLAILSPIIVRILGLTTGAGLISSIYTFITLVFLIMFVPLSVMIELLYSRWKRRKFRTGSFLLLCGGFCEALLVLVVISLAFESAFPELSFTHEPFPGLAGLALGMAIGLPVIAIGLTIRIRRVREYLVKAFD